MSIVRSASVYRTLVRDTSFIDRLVRPTICADCFDFRGSSFLADALPPVFSAAQLTLVVLPAAVTLLLTLRSWWRGLRPTDIFPV
jgi:hypothetical protein